MLNVPGLVCQQLIFVVPLQRGGRHGGELAVERGLLILQHHQVLGSDQRPRKALICERGRQTSAGLHLQASDHQVSSAQATANRLRALLKVANSDTTPDSERLSRAAVCVNTSEGPLRKPNEVSEEACSVSGPSSPPFVFLFFFLNFVDWTTLF